MNPSPSYRVHLFGKSQSELGCDRWLMVRCRPWLSSVRLRESVAQTKGRFEYSIPGHVSHMRGMRKNEGGSEGKGKEGRALDGFGCFYAVEVIDVALTRGFV